MARYIDVMELKPCECGAIPKIKETYDTLQVVCERCGHSGRFYFGDYYDESFMFKIYGERAIHEWNTRISKQKNALKSSLKSE